jgi:hypothetical protein
MPTDEERALALLEAAYTAARELGMIALATDAQELLVKIQPALT